MVYWQDLNKIIVRIMLNEPLSLGRFATGNCLTKGAADLCSFVFGFAHHKGTIENILETSKTIYPIESLEASTPKIFEICLLFMTCKQHIYIYTLTLLEIPYYPFQSLDASQSHYFEFGLLFFVGFVRSHLSAIRFPN